MLSLPLISSSSSAPKGSHGRGSQPAGRAPGSRPWFAQGLSQGGGAGRPRGQLTEHSVFPEPWAGSNLETESGKVDVGAHEAQTPHCRCGKTQCKGPELRLISSTKMIQNDLQTGHHDGDGNPGPVSCSGFQGTRGDEFGWLYSLAV